MNLVRNISIKNKVTIITMLACMIVLLLLLVSFTIVEFALSRRAVVEKMAALAEVIGVNSTAALTFNDQKSAEATLASLNAEPEIMVAAIYTQKGELFALYFKYDLMPKFPSSINEIPWAISAGMPPPSENSRRIKHIFHPDRLEMAKSIVMEGEGIGTLYLQSNLDSLYRRLKWYSVFAFMSLIPALLVAYLLSSKFQRIISKPIMDLAQTMKIVSQEQNYSVQVKKLSEDELGGLTDGFNEMLAQIQKRDLALEQHREELEREVQRRTAELSQSNRELEKTIDELNRATQFLAQNEKRLAYAQQAARLGYWEWLIDSDRMIWSGEVCSLLGMEPEEVGLNREAFLDRIHPVDKALVENALKTSLSTGKSFRVDARINTSIGSVRIVNLYGKVFADNGDKPVRIVGTIQDITQRKEAEEAFQSLVTYAPMGIYIVQQGKFAMINPGFEAITGYTAQDMLGQDCLISVSTEYRTFVREQAIQRLKGERLPPYEYRFIDKSGETGWVMETVTPTQYKGQRAVLGYFMDITPLKKLEAQFLQAQKMEAVGRLAGGIAHDFNNILGIIIGYAEIMWMGLKENDPLCGYLGEIKRAAVRAASLTRQLLAFSRKQIQQIEVINLNEVITDLEMMLHRLIGEDLELVMELASALPSVKADKGQIEQIILNLAVNAKDAMPQGGKLTIQTCDVYLDETYCRDHPYVSPGHFVMMAVSDNGTGMDEETRAHIFEPFYTTKETGKGTGLGLSTVFGIVKQSGGSIEVYSEPGFGTTLKVYFPNAEKTAVSPQAEIHASPLSGHETILVVEDDGGLRPLIIDVLKMYGYQVLEARDGDEALRICQDHEGPIHLMVTDVVMPRMSGRLLAEQVAPLYPQMQVLFMSGYTDDAIVHHGVLHEDTAYIQKPFSPDDLAKKVREVLATSFSK
jgi:PAS domain S-box-containing protein